MVWRKEEIGFLVMEFLFATKYNVGFLAAAEQ
jgi:hypothetical protein